MKLGEFLKNAFTKNIPFKLLAAAIAAIAVILIHAI